MVRNKPLKEINVRRKKFKNEKEIKRSERKKRFEK
jgi:hypothetical protein